MNIHLPQTASNKFIFLAIPLVAVILLLGFILILFYRQNSNLSSELNDLKSKQIVYLFDPRESYVKYSLFYQEVTGKVISFNQDSATLKLDHSGQTFSVQLPLGPNGAYTPQGFRQLEDMYRFKVGDNVEISGGFTPAGQFDISKFVIVK